MRFSEGDYLVYGNMGVCRVEGLEKRSFDGVNEVEYCRLTPYNPYNAGSSTYFVPLDALRDKTRDLLTEDEVLALIDKIPEIKTVGGDNNERKNILNELLRSNDYEKLFCLIKSLHKVREERAAAGKKLSVTDEKMMKAAEGIVYQEFAFVLGIEPEKVTDFIADRING